MVLGDGEEESSMEKLILKENTRRYDLVDDERLIALSQTATKFGCSL